MINEPVKGELYVVAGSSIAEVIASIRAGMMSGFAGYGDQKFAAYAGLNVYHEYQVDCSLFGDCRVNKIKITTRPYMKVPQWSISGSFEASMLPNWFRYINALRVYEEGHIEIGLASASSFVSKFTHPNMVQAINCRDLDLLIRQIFDAEIVTSKQEHLTYNKVTGHGKTPGTDFAWN